MNIVMRGGVLGRNRNRVGPGGAWGLGSTRIDSDRSDMPRHRAPVWSVRRRMPSPATRIGAMTRIGLVTRIGAMVGPSDSDRVRTRLGCRDGSGLGWAALAPPCGRGGRGLGWGGPSGVGWEIPRLRNGSAPRDPGRARSMELQIGLRVQVVLKLDDAESCHSSGVR